MNQEKLAAMTSFILSTGSYVFAALIMYIGSVVAKSVIVISVDWAHIHLIGKLIRVKLKSPFKTL